MTAQRDVRVRRRLSATLAVVVFALLVPLGCGGSNPGAAGGASTDSVAAPLEPQDPGAIHVHGLGYDGGAGVLYIATHTGLFELVDGRGTATRVSDSHQDTMGFSLVRGDFFYGSGHPDAREGLPPHLGLIKSTDRGRSWQPVSLTGEADLHVLRTQGRFIYGVDAATNRFLASEDRGGTWRASTLQRPYVDVAIDPGAPRHLLATDGAALYESTDGGRRWRPIARGVGGLLSWPEREKLYVVDGDGRLLVGTGAAAAWRSVGDVGGIPTAFLAVDGRTLYVALHDGTIKASQDGGSSWSVRWQPAD